MKKNSIKLSILALSMILGSAVPAAAQELSAFYVTPKIMSSYQNGDMPGGHERGSVFGLGLSVGADLSYSSSLPVRVEGEYLYHGNQTFSHQNNTYDVSAHSFLINGFYDITTNSAFTPYLGGGLGLSYLNNNFNGNGGATKDNNWNLAWDLGGGVAWSLNENMAIDLGYRYMDLGKVDNAFQGPQAASLDLTAHEFSLGLRFTGF